jgi:glycosyltransferase involved in cell wall biosynthesis
MSATDNSVSDLRKISIVIPVFNEERNVLTAHDAICSVLENHPFTLEFIFTDNHSEDRTFEILASLANRDPRVKVLRFNRNYGFQRSLLTGYRYATGDAAVQIDCDLQDSPTMIPRFIELWDQGHDVVVGLRRNRQENTLLLTGRRMFYALLSQISEDKVTSGAGDFRLIDRSILDQLRTIHDLHPYVRGIIATLATNEAGIPYDRIERRHGRSKFPLFKLVRFALDGIISHSILPLRLSTYIGLTLSATTFALSIFYIVSALVFGADWPRGFATTTVLLLLGMSLNAIFLGVLGEYVSRIYQQVRHRPLTVIERTINLEA